MCVLAVYGVVVEEDGGRKWGEGLRRQGSWGQPVILTATANHAQQPSQHNLCPWRPAGRGPPTQAQAFAWTVFCSVSVLDLLAGIHSSPAWSLFAVA